MTGKRKKAQQVREDRLAGLVEYDRRKEDGSFEKVREVLCKFRVGALRHAPGIFRVEVVDPKHGEICDHCGLSRLD